MEKVRTTIERVPKLGDWVTATEYPSGEKVAGVYLGGSKMGTGTFPLMGLNEKIVFCNENSIQIGNDADISRSATTTEGYAINLVSEIRKKIEIPGGVEKLLAEQKN